MNSLSKEKVIYTAQDKKVKSILYKNGIYIPDIYKSIHVQQESSHMIIFEKLNEFLSEKSGIKNSNSLVFACAEKDKHIAYKTINQRAQTSYKKFKNQIIFKLRVPENQLIFTNHDEWIKILKSGKIDNNIIENNLLNINNNCKIQILLFSIKKEWVKYIINPNK